MKRNIVLYLFLVIAPVTHSRQQEMLNYTELARLSPAELIRNANEQMALNHVDTAIGYYVVLAGKYNSGMDKTEKYWCAVAYNQIGQVYYQQENLFSAFDLFLKGLQICEQNEFDDLKPDLYKNIGNVYCAFQDVDRGKEYYLKALRLARRQKNEDLESRILNNLVSACCFTQQREEAKKYYRESLMFIGKDPVRHYLRYRNEALIYTFEEKYDQAIGCYRQAASYARQHLLEEKYIDNAHMELAKLYDLKNDIDSALYYCCLNTDNLKGKHVNVLTGSLRLLSHLRDRIKDPQKAIKYKKRWLELSDSVFNLYRSELVKNSKFAYEMDQNRRKIETISQEKEKKEEKIKEQRKALAYTLGCLFVFVALLTIVYIQKKKLKDSYKELFNRNLKIIESEQHYRNERLKYEKGQNLQMANIGTEIAGNANKDIYATSKLSEMQKKSLLQAINDIMENTAEFCNSDFGIDRLVELVGSNSRYISQVINEVYNMNFRTFINEYRIREAQIRLMDTDKYGHFTIKAIAESVGYKSQANFIETFKKITGMTPSVYQKIAREKR